MKKCKIVITLIITVSLLLTSCGDEKANYVDDSIENIDFSNDSPEIAIGNNLTVSYSYPDNPVDTIRSWLQDEVKKRSLPIVIGDIRQTGLQEEFTVSFINDSDNACVFSFALRDYLLLDGKDNPSFSIAFKDPDNSEDMILILTAAIMYIAPELSLDEATEMAIAQDKTISTDGYSMPRDIGGYQVQARYTNPHTFFSSEEFESKMGVTVTALKQIWGEPNTQNARELKTTQDFSALYYTLVKGDEEQERTVYADFIIKNVWNHLEWLHGDTWVTVDVLSMEGVQYTLRLENMRMLMDYEFGVGQQYTLFIYTGAANGSLIYYAVQQSESENFNSRGEFQPLDYPTEDWENGITRTEPKDGDAVYNVFFQLHSRSYEPFVVLEGYGVGEGQWPLDPQRDGYEFAGWYDNEDFSGTPYSKEMPIYQDTILYAKWKYSGPGGVWPRSHHGIINGVSEGEILKTNQTISIIAEGYNMHFEVPNDQRFRWVPIGWKVENMIVGEFSDKAPYSASFSIDAQGGYKLYITYKEEIFDGIAWQETGQMLEVEEVDFQIAEKVE